MMKVSLLSESPSVVVIQTNRSAMTGDGEAMKDGPELEGGRLLPVLLFVVQFPHQPVPRSGKVHRRVRHSLSVVSCGMYLVHGFLLRSVA